ncbi:MAG: hypothetical protein K0Q73_5270 [Paenibacillus sp.]|nr:hypothetical protein [Paenibacillus sp.]
MDEIKAFLFDGHHLVGWDDSTPPEVQQFFLMKDGH